MPRRLIAAAFACIVSGMLPAAHAETPAKMLAKTSAWPQAGSDLKAEADIRFGVLGNGMRFAIMRNDTPPGQAAIRLRIGSGSLQEADDQQGLVTGLVTTTQQVGITVGIPLLGVLATTATSLEHGVHVVLALDAAIVLAAAVVVGLGLRVWRPAGAPALELAGAEA